MKLNGPILLLALIALLATGAAEGLQSARSGNDTVHYGSVNFLPGAQVVRFEATFAIPQTTKVDSSDGRNRLSIYPELMPDNEPVTGNIQNILTNDRMALSDQKWSFFPYRDGDHSYDSASSRMTVLPAQALTSLFTFNEPNNQVLSTWIVESGYNANGTDFTGSIAFGNSTSPKRSNSVLNKAAIVIELWNSAMWDFGPIIFQNIVVVAQTTSGGWCGLQVHSLAVEANDPTASTINNADGTVTCYVPRLKISGPAQ